MPEWPAERIGVEVLYAFKAPSDAERISEDALKNLDDVRPGAAAKGQ